MELKFKIAGRIAKPVHEVFEAVADPKKLSGYFTTGGAKGRLETGAEAGNETEHVVRPVAMTSGRSG